MISMIAHQWRQPLAAITSVLMSVDVKLARGTFDLTQEQDRKKFLDYLHKKHHNIHDYVQFLSTTTSDFRNFFNPHKEKEFVRLTRPIEKALEILQKNMQSHGIEIEINLQEDEEILLYKNEVIQVMLNILNNAQDNFLVKQTKNPKVIIKTHIDKHTATISICDNGGGIPNEIIDTVFDPYFSTKDEQNGTGLGLYMSKIIIEEHHNGILMVNNVDKGVCFDIIFNPKE